MKYIQTHPEVRQRDGSRLSSVISVEKLGQKLGLWYNFPFNCHLANRDKKWKTDFHEIFMKYWSWAKGNELFMMFWFPKGLLPLIDRWPRGFDKAANYVLLPLITGVCVSRALLSDHVYCIPLSRKYWRGKWCCIPFKRAHLVLEQIWVTTPKSFLLLSSKINCA